MTYAEAFLCNRYAQVATQIGHSYGKPAAWMHQTAWLLHAKNSERIETRGRPMSDDHLKQEAVRLAK